MNTPILLSYYELNLSKTIFLIVFRFKLKVFMYLNMQAQLYINDVINQ